MRSAIKVIALTSLVTFGFVAGALTAGMRHWFHPICHVAIKNDSGQTVSSLKFTHESGGLTSVVALPALKQGHSTEVHFFVAGEGGYQIDATLADGRVIRGGAGYIETGYKATEIVGASTIENKSIIYGF